MALVVLGRLVTFVVSASLLSVAGPKLEMPSPSLWLSRRTTLSRETCLDLAPHLFRFAGLVPALSCGPLMFGREGNECDESNVVGLGLTSELALQRIVL